MQVRLVTFVILTVLVVSAVGVFLDYRREYNQHINAILASLEEQARTLKAARKRTTQHSIFAKYVDDFCAQMNEFISPGHHILILDETGAVMVSAQHHSGVEVVDSLISANPDDQIICVGKHRLAQIRLKDEDGTTIILAQYLDHMEQILRSQLISRGLVITATAIILIFLIYLIIKSWVIKPVNNLLTTAKQWAKSNFSIRSGAMGAAEFRVLSEGFNSMAEQLEAQENQRIGELEQARKIQTKLLPVSQPTVSGLSITAEYHPAKHIAGDLYDIFSLPGDRIAIAILDVCGHGISAALLTGVVKMSLHRRLAEKDYLAEAMKLVNDDLLACTPDGKFITACVGVWNQGEQTWTYCAAGHPGGLLLSQNHARFLESTAPLIGVFHETDWSLSKVHLSEGDRIFLYTDGVTDAGVTKGQNVPYDLDKILLNCNVLPLTEQVATIISETIRYGSGESHNRR